MIRWVFEKWWSAVLGLALIAWIAGVAVMLAVASNGGNALGQGLKGGFTVVGAIGDGYAQADAVDSQMKAAAASQKIRELEKRAKKATADAKRAEARAKRAERGGS
jgi:hypothetical protein